MASAELASRLAERIDWNEATAAEYESQLRRRPVERDDPRVPDHMRAHEAEEHHARAGVLRLLRDHLVPDDTYLLGERDLQFADLVPEFSIDCCMPPKPAASEVH